MPGVFPVDPGPDPRAVAFLEAKGLKRSWRWPSLWGTEHAYAFTLAGVYRLDVLAAVHQLVTEAVKNGETLEGFRGRLEERLIALGFAGPQAVTEFPEGPRKVDLTATWRARVIYDTNVRQAYAASRWQMIEDTAADFPALEYHHSDKVRQPRLQHLAWDGIVLPVSHPFWTTHFPPNGWGCKCFVRQISVSKLNSGRVKLTTPEALAKTGYTDKPASWPTWRHDATGREEPVPPGVTPGFGHNAGQARRQNLADLMARRLEGMDPDLARAAASDLANFPQFADMVADANATGEARARTRAEEAARLIAAGMKRAEAINTAQAKADAERPWPKDAWPIGVAPDRIGWGYGGEVPPRRLVVTNPAAIGHSADIHATTPADWGKVQVMLEQGEVWGDGSGERLVFLQFPDAAGQPRWWVLILKPVDAAWRVKTLFPTSPRRREAMTKAFTLVDGRPD